MRPLLREEVRIRFKGLWTSSMRSIRTSRKGVPECIHELAMNNILYNTNVLHSFKRTCVRSAFLILPNRVPGTAFEI